MPFRDVIGHRRLIGLLAQSVARHTLLPSLVFAGPAGVGKRLTATALAQALNCLDPQEWQPPPVAGVQSQAHGIDACGICSACTRIARGVHPDVLVLEPGDNGSIRIDQVRDVIDRAAYRPFEGKRRVVVIDEADALMAAAQNALLKTLEEPPPSSTFVLVTARPDVLLATVRSRCTHLRFRALAAHDVATALVARGLDRTEALAVAATADGSLGRALEARGDELVAARDAARHVLAHAASAPDARHRLEGAKELLAGTGAGGASDRERLAVHLRAIASLLRDIELLSLAPSVSVDVASLANPDVRPELERLTPAYGGGRGRLAFAAVDRALVALERNASPKIVADWLVLEL